MMINSLINSRIKSTNQHEDQSFEKPSHLQKGRGANDSVYFTILSKISFCYYSVAK
jgi:hypothetical protein